MMMMMIVIMMVIMIMMVMVMMINDDWWLMMMMMMMMMMMITIMILIIMIYNVSSTFLSLPYSIESCQETDAAATGTVPAIISTAPVILFGSGKPATFLRVLATAVGWATATPPPKPVSVQQVTKVWLID